MTEPDEELEEPEEQRRRWTDEIVEKVKAEGLPITDGAARAVELIAETLDQTWGARYARLARRLWTMVLIIALACAVTIGGEAAILAVTSADSARQDRDIIEAQVANCQAFDALRDAEVIIFLRAYGASDPIGARKIAVLYGYKRVVFPPPSPQAAAQNEAQRAAAAAFFTDAIQTLAEAQCHTARSEDKKKREKQRGADKTKREKPR